MNDKIKPAVVLTLICLLVFGIYAAGNEFYISEVDNAQLHFIDVGHGDSILIRCNDKNMLIDAGTDYASDRVISYIESLGIEELDIVVATHPHDDHIGGMDEVVEMFGAKKLYMPEAEADTEAYDEFADAIDGVKVIYPKVGDRFSLGDAKFTVLGPAYKYYKNLNNYSLCLKMTYGLNSFLLTGDAEAMAERGMLLSGIELEADVLKAGHHGSDTASGEAFVEAVRPAITVISADEENSYGLPDENVIERLEKYGKVYRTDINGNIVVSSDGENITVQYDSD